MLLKSGFQAQPNVLVRFTEMISDLAEQEGREFGNARSARNLFEQSLRNQAARLIKEGGELTRERLKIITAEDLGD